MRIAGEYRMTVANNYPTTAASPAKPISSAASLHKTITSERKAPGTRSLEYKGKHVERDGCDTAVDQHPTDRVMKAIIWGPVEE